MRRLAPAIAAALAVAAVLPQQALAHAYLVTSSPGYGDVLTHAPGDIRLTFNDSVRPARGNEAVSNATGRSVLAGRARIDARDPRVLVLPLVKGLGPGDYTARWRIVSEDGHTEEGLLAFAVGSGSAPPTAKLPLLGTSLGVTNLVGRALFVLGVLLALGAAVFAVAVWRPAARRSQLDPAEEAELRKREARVTSVVLFFSFLLAQAGSVLAVLHTTGATRYGRIHELGIVFAGVGAAATASTILPLRLLTGIAALALATTLPLSGHALDPGEPRLLSFPADLVHVCAAAVWLGGLVQLVFVLLAARSLEPKDRRRFVSHLASGFARIAIVCVFLIALTGLGRAFVELRSVEQLWTLSYGRAILVKTALLGAVLAFAWLNRSRLIGLGHHRSAAPSTVALLAEIGLLLGVVGTVAVLTELRPGRTLNSPARPARAAVDQTSWSATVTSRPTLRLSASIACRPRSMTGRGRGGKTLKQRQGHGCGGRLRRGCGHEALDVVW